MRLYVNLVSEDELEATLDDPPDEEEPAVSEESKEPELEMVWLGETAGEHLKRAVRNAIFMSCPGSAALFADPPELEFDSSDDGVLLVTCEAIRLEVPLAVTATKEANGDLTMVIHDGPELQIELTIPDDGYSQIG